jgi:hypothetical protein
VLDCSVTMTWCFDDEAKSHTDSVRDTLADVRAVVPAIWPLEVANATTVGKRKDMHPNASCLLLDGSDAHP